VHVAAVRFELFLPDCHTLKQKRAVVKPILEGARRRYHVAAAEVSHLDSWQRADLGVSTVGNAVTHLTEVLDEVERFVWSFPEIEVLAARRTWLDGDAEED
jgi:uncharacterized protein YlxP (DUF503 family)